MAVSVSIEILAEVSLSLSPLFLSLQSALNTERPTASRCCSDDLLTVPSESIHTPQLNPHFVLQPEFKMD